jgi:hypothetical protein
MPKTPGNHRQDNRTQSNLAASKSFNPTIVAGTASASSPAIEDKDRATSQGKKIYFAKKLKLRDGLFTCKRSSCQGPATPAGNLFSSASPSRARSK